MSERELGRLAAATGPVVRREYGCMYSDLHQRRARRDLAAVPDCTFIFNGLIEALAVCDPIPPFTDHTA